MNFHRKALLVSVIAGLCFHLSGCSFEKKKESLQEPVTPQAPTAVTPPEATQAPAAVLPPPPAIPQMVNPVAPAPVAPQAPEAAAPATQQAPAGTVTPPTN